jgi:hypothetical protein
VQSRLTSSAAPTSGDRNATPWSASAGAIACAMSALSGPMTTTAPAAISSSADRRLRSRSSWVSRDTIRRRRPWMPPPALTRSAA